MHGYNWPIISPRTRTATLWCVLGLRTHRQQVIHIHDDQRAEPLRRRWHPVLRLDPRPRIAAVIIDVNLKRNLCRGGAGGGEGRRCQAMVLLATWTNDATTYHAARSQPDALLLGCGVVL